MKKLISFMLLALTSIAFAQEEVENPNQKFIDFMAEYNHTIVTSHDKMTLMHKKRKLSKLGKEKAKGDITGTIKYNARVRGFFGVVTIAYENYSDIQDITLNGFTNVRANINANGKMFGTVTVDGTMKGKVSYDEILIKKGNAAGGCYIVELEDGSMGRVGWDEIPEESIQIDNEEVEITEEEVYEE